ncbi:hypothetical protein ACFV4T_21080 [Streptomyces sp. NPDC059755]|uniref:hypothetical protein n=1 Tax=Streptomyces sp. NPDC059755 TaxID=3346934 RepID=UPI0036501CDC
MEFFPIAALIIATFLLLIGIVGRGASMGSSQFHITLEGSIGRLPRIAILTVSILTYIIAIFLFFYAAESKSSSEQSPATTVAESEVASTITLKVESSIYEGAINERDTITIEDYVPLILQMDRSITSTNGAFYLDDELSERLVSYSVEVTITNSDGTEETYYGEGTITAGDGLAYSVMFYDDGSAGLEPS